MGFLQESLKKGAIGLVGLGAGAAFGPEAVAPATSIASSILESDLASKGIKSLVNHQFSFGKKKLSARDVINKIKGLPENIVQKLPEKYQSIGRDIAGVITSDIGNVIQSENPLLAGKDLYKQAKDINRYASKLGIHDALGKIGKDAGLSQKNIDLIGGLAKNVINKAIA